MKREEKERKENDTALLGYPSIRGNLYEKVDMFAMNLPVARNSKLGKRTTTSLVSVTTTLPGERRIFQTFASISFG